MLILWIFLILIVTFFISSLHLSKQEDEFIDEYFNNKF